MLISLPIVLKIILIGEKYTYRIDSSLGILFKYYYGNIDLSDIIISWEDAIENNVIPKETKGFILDYRQASFTINVDDYVLIADFYKNHLDIFKNLKIAILTEKPKDVVIPLLVESKDDGYFSKPFYTLEAAIAWVLS